MNGVRSDSAPVKIVADPLGDGAKTGVVQNSARRGGVGQRDFVRRKWDRLDSVQTIDAIQGIKMVPILCLALQQRQNRVCLARYKYIREVRRNVKDEPHAFIGPIWVRDGIMSVHLNRLGAHINLTLLVWRGNERTAYPEA